MGAEGVNEFDVGFGMGRAADDGLAAAHYITVEEVLVVCRLGLRLMRGLTRWRV